MAGHSTLRYERQAIAHPVLFLPILVKTGKFATSLSLSGAKNLLFYTMVGVRRTILH
jgi:hypothetical protein